MIRAGDTVVNPVTGERLVFELTSGDTEGELTRFVTIVDPDGFVAAAHVHPFQSERFEVLSGRLAIKRGRAKEMLNAGDVAVIEPGTPHTFWNPTGEVVRFRAEVRPSLQFESLIETMFALAAEGKTNRKGMPNPLRLAVIANHHFDVVRLPVVPQALQKAALVPGSLLGRIVGYKPVWEAAAPVPVPA